MEPKDHTVAVLGASPKPSRYSNMAIRMLKSYRYDIIPVHPIYKKIEDIPVTASLKEIKKKVDTLTLYVGPMRSKVLLDEIISLNPGRVILNPGTESVLLEQKLAEAGIPAIKACTLVMLQSRQF